MSTQLIAHCGATKITQEELLSIPTPEATRTHQPIPHWKIVEALIETLGFRHIEVVNSEFAVTPDGMKCFGVLELSTTWDEVRFSIGIRNSNDKSLRLGLTVGYRVRVCDNLAFDGDFTPVLAKHSARLDLIDVISVGVDRMQRNFEPMKDRIWQWRHTPLSDEDAKLILYEAFVEGSLEVPLSIASQVHNHYFRPHHFTFEARNLWSLSNAFTSAFKELKPISQYKAAAKLSPFLQKFADPQIGPGCLSKIPPVLPNESLVGKANLILNAA